MPTAQMNEDWATNEVRHNARCIVGCSLGFQGTIVVVCISSPSGDKVEHCACAARIEVATWKASMQNAIVYFCVWVGH